MSKAKKKHMPNGNLDDLEDDESLNAYLRRSSSEEEVSGVDTGRISKYLNSPKSNNLYDISDESLDDDDDESAGGLMGTGKMFLKKKTSNKEPPIPASRNFSPSYKSMRDAHGNEINRDSLEDETMSSFQKDKGINGISMNGLMPELNLNLGASSASYSESITAPGPQSRNVVSIKAGKETLDELADRERFFSALEKGQDHTVDYSALNRELDQQETFAGATLNMHEEMPEEEEEMSMSETPHSGRPEALQNGDVKGGMLEKVALMSFDSSMGSKPTASRDRGLGVHTIDESHTESHDRDASDQGMDQPDAMIYQPSEHTEGITMKTQTGYGDTSYGLENEYQNAIGLGTADGETLKDSDTLGGKSSMFNTQKTHIDAGTMRSDQNQNTPEFGLEPMPIMKQEKRDGRTADDLLRAARALRRAEDRPSVHFNVPNEEGESDGFDVTPHQIRVSQSQEPSALELSPIAKHHDSFLKAQFETSQGPDSSAQQESTPIAASKGKKKARERFSHVRSSGYGHSKKPVTNGPTSNKHMDSQPEEVRPPLTDSTESTRGMKKPSVASILMSNSSKKNKHNDGTTTPGGSIVHNDKLMSSITQLVHQLQSEISARPGRASHNSTLSQPEAKWSAEGPVLSSSQRVAVMEREQQMHKELKRWQEECQEARKIQAKLTVDSAAQERHHKREVEQMKIAHEKELFELKQQNFIMAAKIADDDESRKPVAMGDAGDCEKAKLMEKEIREQEKLLAGYQQENERIYQELKTLQKSSKETESQMFKENQRLSAELSTAKEDLSRRELELRNKGLITSPAVQQQIAGGAALGAARIGQLEDRLKEAQRQEALLYQEIELHKQAKQDVEYQLQALTQQLGDMDVRLNDVKTANSKQSKAKQSELEREVERLQKKLKWYAENQQLLDKDKHVIHSKDDEIKRLKVKLNSLNTDSGRRVADMRAKTKERSMEAKRIQDLERQVKEMEGILKKRHPDSIPMMIWAANHLPADDDVTRGAKPMSVQFLESRIGKLEKELEERDEEAKRDIRVLEQKYSAMKLQYEERINDLEDRLVKYERPGDQNLKEGQRPHSSASAIQRELDSVRDRSKKELQDLRTEIERLMKENTNLKNKEAAHERGDRRKDKDSDLELRIKALQLEVSSQERLNQLLKSNVDKLHKEKQQLLAENVRNPGRPVNGDRKSLRDRGRPKSAGSVRTRSHSESRRSSVHSDQLQAYTTQDHVTRREKYEPDAFSGQHVSDILRENEELKIKVDRLQLDCETQRVTVSKVLAEAEDKERRLREHSQQQVQALTSAHQSEVQRVYAETAITYSTSKMAELTSKVDTQEVAIQFLKDQLRVARTDSEQLATLKIRETALEAQVKQYSDELKEARHNHTPEMRHFHALTDKISQLELRHETRERELQQIIQQTRVTANADFTEEVAKWKRIVEAKNKEIEQFKTELDSILEVLRELQRQGVLLPCKPGIGGGALR